MLAVDEWGNLGGHGAEYRLVQIAMALQLKASLRWIESCLSAPYAQIQLFKTRFLRESVTYNLWKSSAQKSEMVKTLRLKVLVNNISFWVPR
jgi:hypothetical protein